MLKKNPARRKSIRFFSRLRRSREVLLIPISVLLKGNLQ